MTRGSVIHWFRKGLRIHDNPALLAAIKADELILRPVFVLDPWFVKNARVGGNRWRFLVQSLEDLDASLRQLGSRLFVARGKPEEVMEKLINKWDVKRITWEMDTEPYAKERDAKIEKLVKTKNVKIEIFTSHTLYDPEQVVAKNKGETPLSYQKMLGLLSSLGPPPKPLDAPTELSKESKIPSADLDKVKYDVPSLSELNVKEEELYPCLYPGGEKEGLQRMDEQINMKRASWVRNFEKPKTSPNALSPATTVLSPHLKFGTVSARLFYWKLEDVYRGAKHSQPPVSLHGQLLWREFFYTTGATVPNFDRMKDNPICKQIPWGDDDKLLDAWANARTGYPFIDAIMTQLRREGWIHHLARHAVACFLTRGDLWQSWERGKEVFEELLLDADWSLNAANWMWLSASSFFYQFFRCYSPIAFGKKTDPDGSYIRKYIPQLAKFPDKYIYQPWEAPLAVQKAAGCIIGQDYPRPIVDHAVVSKENMAKMKKAYDAGKAEATSKKENSGKRKADDDGSQKKSKKQQNISTLLKNEH